jgi:hypothetical protein
VSRFSLFSWQKKQALPLHVVQYTRRGCHLCDQAWMLLERYQRRYGFRLDAVDVDSNPDLAALHGDWVPVVTVNGKVRFRGRVNEVLLKRVLDASS